MYRTLKKPPMGHAGRVGCDCPICGERTIVEDTAELTVRTRCPHFVRRWRVAADQRVRAEFRTEAAATALL